MKPHTANWGLSIVSKDSNSDGGNGLDNSIRNSPKCDIAKIYVFDPVPGLMFPCDNFYRLLKSERNTISSLPKE